MPLTARAGALVLLLVFSNQVYYRLSTTFMSRYADRQSVLTTVGAPGTTLMHTLFVIQEIPLVNHTVILQ